MRSIHLLRRLMYSIMSTNGLYPREAYMEGG